MQEDIFHNIKNRYYKQRMRPVVVLVRDCITSEEDIKQFSYDYAIYRDLHPSEIDILIHKLISEHASHR